MVVAVDAGAVSDAFFCQAAAARTFDAAKFADWAVDAAVGVVVADFFVPLCLQALPLVCIPALDKVYPYNFQIYCKNFSNNVN